MAEDTTKPKRRLVKKAETVREKAEKASVDLAQPRRLQATRRRAGAPFRLIGRIFRRLDRIKLFHIIGLILFPPYFRNSWKELRQVTWLKFPASLRLVFAVIVFSVVFGLVVALLDFILGKIFREVLLK